MALEILLQEENVSRAAARMHVGQSAMSAALARLRVHFDDELLTVVGRRMVPTSLAEAMREPLREAILHIESVIEIDRSFNPLIAHRSFTVEIPDHLVPVLLPRLVRQLSVSGPNIRLEVRMPVGDPSPLLQKGEIDLVVTPSIYSDPAYVTEPLIRNDLVVVGWSENPALKTQPDLETIQSLGQVIVKFDRIRLSSFLSAEQLSLYGGAGRTALIAPSFSSIPPTLVGTALIAVLNRRLVNAMAQVLPLAVWELPIAMPLMDDVIMFHPMRKHDQGLGWLREQMREALADISSSGAASS
ncbi:LysR family transcriptional regulator [Sphingorhabdus sp.]|uniref:LysR family transcriptional regulator n=1 Tax=Sphingorhabdus sp. TaxID=1902408 RepID=UPI003918B07D